DPGAQRLLKPLMILFAIERLGNRAARSGRIHRGNEPVLFESGPVGGSDQVEALDPQPGRLSTAIVEARAARKNAARHALFDATLALNRAGRLSQRGGRGSHLQKFAAT